MAESMRAKGARRRTIIPMTLALLSVTACSAGPATLKPGKYHVVLMSGPPGVMQEIDQDVGKLLCLSPGEEEGFPNRVAEHFVMTNSSGTITLGPRVGDKFSQRDGQLDNCAQGDAEGPNFVEI